MNGMALVPATGFRNDRFMYSCIQSYLKRVNNYLQIISQASMLLRMEGKTHPLRVRIPLDLFDRLMKELTMISW